MKRFAFIFLCSACGGSSVKPELTSVGPATAAACANGGTTITIASDTNGNGKIDPGETTSTQSICNAPPPVAQTLTASSPIAAGQDGCQLGGIAINSGIDNGAGGGTANNGVLEPGEITSTQEVCASPGIVRQGALAGPGSPAGAFTVSANGGMADATGAAGDGGGNAGSLTIEGAGSLGGSTAIFKSGVADASFTTPTLTANLGGSKAEIAGTVPVDTSVPVGAGYFVALGLDENNRLIYTPDGGTTLTVVSGIHIQSGAVLDFPTGVIVSVDNDIWNEGSITSETSDLDLGCDNYIGADGSSVTTTAATTAAPMIQISAAAAFINGKAAMTTTGVAGRSAGNIELSAGGALYNAGALTANGGSISGTADLAGGNVTLNAILGVYNSGAIDTTAGDSGTIAEGGLAGSITLIANNGDVVNAGPLTANGGNGDSGGSGNSVLLQGFGDIINAADLSTLGGAAHGASAIAGTAGTITISTFGSADKNSAGQTKGSVTVSGNLHADGGASDTGAGGGGNSIGVFNEITGDFDGQQVLLLGYTNVSLVGGQGAQGGLGGTLSLDAQRTGVEPAIISTTNISPPGGAAVNEADIDVSAGASTAATPSAQAAGAVTITAGETASEAVAAVVINRGAITGTSASAASATVQMIGHDGVENDGPITVNTGDNVNLVVLLHCASGTASNSGAIDVSSSDDAAAAGRIGIVGPLVKNTANLTANGAASISIDGGDGGGITLTSSDGTTTNSGTLTASGGAGAVAAYPGLAGAITIDGKSQP